VAVAATDIAPEAHVRMQAALQRFVDNAISKTVNMPATATPDDPGDVPCGGVVVVCRE
jgi:ribonucleoside-diphosphate reductase alpha chain